MSSNSRSLLSALLQGHGKGVYPLAFIPADDNHQDCGSYRLGEMDLLVSGSADCTARVWSAVTADCRHILSGHTLPIHAIAVNNSDKTIFTAGADGLIMSFCSITGDVLRTMYGHEAAILRFETHKNMLYSASVDKTVRAWVMEFGEDTRVFRGSRAPVTCVQYFSGFGESVIAFMYFAACFPSVCLSECLLSIQMIPFHSVICGSEDGCCRIFDSKSGTQLRCFRGHTSAITDVRCVPRKVFTAHQDGSLLVWNSAGIQDETVFRDFDENSLSSDSQSDSSDVKNAVRILEKYPRQR
jgi:WD40 repeat protein